jgi:hypothetical protein
LKNGLLDSTVKNAPLAFKVTDTCLFTSSQLLRSQSSCGLIPLNAKKVFTTSNDVGSESNSEIL